MEYWSFGKKIIYAIPVLLVSLSTFAINGFGEHFAHNLAETAGDHGVGGTKSEPVILAQSSTESSTEGKQATVDNQNTPGESPTSSKEGSGAKSAEAETKPIKPFKPSEEIAAEQAVDFPWDI